MIWDAMMARIGWVIGDLAILIFVLVGLMFCLVVYGIYNEIRERLCKHSNGVRRDGPAGFRTVCRDCGKEMPDDAEKLLH